MSNRARPEEDAWVSYEPDWLRNTIGAGRSTTNVTTTASFTLGLEGDFPSGAHSWDMSLSTGRSDNVVDQIGSMSLVAYRNLLASPNFGRNATFDQNPWEFGGFAESTPTCTTGLPIVKRFQPSQNCVQMVSPDLKNIREMTQTMLEANLVGDLAEMRAGPLQYALGVSYRENSFNYHPDNLSDVENIVSSIAGLFPNEPSRGEFDVTEIYGELLVPIISDGPTGVEHLHDSADAIGPQLQRVDRSQHRIVHDQSNRAATASTQQQGMVERFAQVRHAGRLEAGHVQAMRCDARA